MSDDTPSSPELSTLLSVFGEALLDSLRVMLPGRITAYNPTTQMASVQPLIMHAHVDETERRVAKPLPEIHTVPVVFNGTSRGRITWPVAVGDTCEIRFSSSSIARWVLKGGGPLDPGDDRRHDLNDAVCSVGLHDAAHVPTTAPVDAIVLHTDGGTKALIGGPTGTQPTIMATTWQAAMDTFVASIVTALSGIIGGAGTPVATAWTNFKASGYKTTKTEVK